jgi:hypothetical protein
LLGLVLLAAPTPSGAGSVTPFVFGAAGEQEVPPVETAATGGCYAVLDVTQVNITCAHDVVDASAAHIHRGAPGVAGPIVFNLGDPSTSPFFASWADLTPREIADLLAGDLYVNIHSNANPTGEIRGQIVERTIDDFVFFPDEGQEVPPTGSEATGICSGDLSDDVITLAVGCSHDVFMPTAAHIHRGGAGVNGPILFNLGDPTSPIMSVAALLPPDIAELAAGLLYVNIHSAAFPGGEIRGQMVVEQIFADGFESGDTSAWTHTVP